MWIRQPLTILYGKFMGVSSNERILVSHTRHVGLSPITSTKFAGRKREGHKFIWAVSVFSKDIERAASDSGRPRINHGKAIGQGIEWNEKQKMVIAERIEKWCKNQKGLEFVIVTDFG